MEIVWTFNDEEIRALKKFVAHQADNAFVRSRLRTNVENPPEAVSIREYWQVMVGALLSSQQRSGPQSYVSRFLATRPFPLAYEVYRRQDDKLAAGRRALEEAGGIRFTNRIADYLARNYEYLADGGWEKTEGILESIIDRRTVEAERSAADFIRHNFIGFGPKQSRNLLQGLGLTRYEIPIDSRITRWLNRFGFAVHLSAGGLQDPDYYNFVSDGIQAMCAEAGIYPCVFDAAVFSSYDDGWNDENIVW